MKVEQECPQCGGPVVLDETDRFLACSYCRVRLYITSKGYFRYSLASPPLTTEHITYVPYWRFRGMHYLLKGYNVHSKILDATFLAYRNKVFPSSLGMRTQTLKLRFISSGPNTRFLDTQLPFSPVFSGIGDSPLLQAFIGDLTSIVYSPVYFTRNAVYDAILNRPMAQRTQLIPDTLQYQSHHTSWDVNFISAQCPRCGWELTGEGKSVVLLCRHCDSAWQPSGDSFRDQSFGTVPINGNNAHYIPFWRLKVLFDGVRLETYGDLIKVANLPKVAPRGSHEKELFFWVPAFTGNPSMFLRLARQLTLQNPGADFEEGLPGNNISPVTLSCSEALESVKITLADLAVVKKNVFSVLPELDVKLQYALLVFLPFDEQGSEFIQPRMKFSIPRNAIRGL